MRDLVGYFYSYTYLCSALILHMSNHFLLFSPPYVPHHYDSSLIEIDIYFHCQSKNLVQSIRTNDRNVGTYENVNELRYIFIEFVPKWIRGCLSGDLYRYLWVYAKSGKSRKSVNYLIPSRIKFRLTKFSTPSRNFDNFVRSYTLFNKI